MLELTQIVCQGIYLRGFVKSSIKGTNLLCLLSHLNPEMTSAQKLFLFPKGGLLTHKRITCRI